MADWSSLINSPPPTNFPTICECEGHILASNDIRGRSKVIEVSAHLPHVDTNLQDPKIGHKLQAADSTFWSAKQAFLPAEAKSSAASTILSSNGFLENFLANHEETWWFRLLSSLLFFGPSSKMSSDDLIAMYSNTRDLKAAPIRCLAWHPQVSKLALAMKDDAVQVVLTSASIKPLLKHKKQRQVQKPTGS